MWLAKITRHDVTLLESLKKDSPALYDIAWDFEKSYRDADVVCFYEKEARSYGLLRTQVRRLFSLHSLAAGSY